MCIAKGKSLLRWYGQQNADSLPTIPCDVLNRVVDYLDDILSKKQANCCVNYRYILTKCLYAIGETKYAEQVRDMGIDAYRNKQHLFESAWSRAFPI